MSYANVLPLLQSVLYHDAVEGNVYLSEDEGRTWRLVDGIPREEAYLLMEHPFDNRIVCLAKFLIDSPDRYTGIRLDKRNKTLQDYG
jgi:hypothetical protein